MQVPAETVTVDGVVYPLTVTAVVPLGRVTEADLVVLPDPPVGWRWQPGFSFDQDRTGMEANTARLMVTYRLERA